MNYRKWDANYRKLNFVYHSFLKNDKAVNHSNGEVSFAYPKAWADAEAVVYIYLKSAEAGKFSDSIYVGSIVLSE